MDGAQFRTMREMMGIDTDWLADQLGVNPRTAQRWETRNPPPLDAVCFLKNWWHRYLDLALGKLAESQDLEVVHLVRYKTPTALEEAGIKHWTPSMHAALVGLQLALLEASGKQVQITWDD